MSNYDKSLIRGFYAKRYSSTTKNHLKGIKIMASSGKPIKPKGK